MSNGSTAANHSSFVHRKLRPLQLFISASTAKHSANFCPKKRKTFAGCPESNKPYISGVSILQLPPTQQQIPHKMDGRVDPFKTQTILTKTHHCTFHQRRAAEFFVSTPSVGSQKRVNAECPTSSAAPKLLGI